MDKASPMIATGQMEEVKSPVHKRPRIAGIFMIDTKTGQRKITEKGPVISDSMAKAMMMPNNALKRVETTLPFEVIDTVGDVS